MTKKSQLFGRLLRGYRSLARFLFFIAGSPPTDEQNLLALARNVGRDWIEGPYYDEAERDMDSQWKTIIWPLIERCDFTCVVDLAAGHGRNSEKLRHLTKKLYVVDINKANIKFLKNRFAGCQNIVYVQNDGISLKEIGDNEVTLVYSFDAMVHFDSDVVRAYLKEFQRVLKPGGFGLPLLKLHRKANRQLSRNVALEKFYVTRTI